MSVNSYKSVGANFKLTPPIFVALDVDTDEKAWTIANEVAPFVGGIKIGPRLTYKYGATLTQKLSELMPVFVDNKYHDIPSTVLAALKTTFAAGATFATVHAGQGHSALKEFAALEKELNHIRPFKILAVTVLTSLDATTFPLNWKSQSSLEHVTVLAGEVVAAGLTGLVCSPEEVFFLRQKYPEVFLVTPGIRTASEKRTDDQKRIMSATAALNAGASALVIGRPIIEAENPIHIAKDFFSQCKK